MNLLGHFYLNFATRGHSDFNIQVLSVEEETFRVISEFESLGLDASFLDLARLKASVFLSPPPNIERDHASIEFRS